MFYLPTCDPMDDVTRGAAPPAGGPGAGVPSDGDHDQLGGVQPDRVQGFHRALLDKFAGRLHSEWWEAYWLSESDSAGDNRRVERERRVTWCDGAGVREERSDLLHRSQSRSQAGTGDTEKRSGNTWLKGIITIEHVGTRLWGWRMNEGLNEGSTNWC